MQVTTPTQASKIQRQWHLVDVKDKILGRAAVEIASKLIGKSKPYFVRNLDCGDYVVVINAKHVKVTGHKEKEKVYTRYSGYPGGLKSKALWQLRAENPIEIIRRAVMGMLPKNKLRARMITRLHIEPEADHTFQSKFLSNA
ncbi:MAG TPA: 50S ribosomal protein L13 [Patescibacteria group bacterium]|nr:50S ribosomal protein L13 [Patescibacteria group bacterium]